MREHAVRRHRSHRHPSAAGALPYHPLSVRIRATTYSILGALWLSGCLWLVLHYLFPEHTDFGAAPNRFEPTALKAHGWLAALGLLLLGWLSATHVVPRWNQPRRRASGISMVALALLLSLSGYGLYYLADRPHELAALTHEALGALSVAVALIHWTARRGKPRVRAGRDGFTVGSAPKAHTLTRLEQLSG